MLPAERRLQLPVTEFDAVGPRSAEHVTGFTNGEEEEVKLTRVVPFLVEDEPASS